MSDLKYSKLVYFIFGISILFSQVISTSAPLDKEGQIFDLNQKMSISMIDSDIKSVLMLIGELTNVNVVVSPDVKDTITANLENVSVKAALDVILKPIGYSYTFYENIIIVQEGDDAKLVGALKSVIIKLKYINAEDLNSPMKRILTSEGSIEAFTPLVTPGGGGGGSISNVVIVTEVEENLDRVLNMINQLDTAIPNVNIAVRFIETNMDTSRGHGIDWTSTPAVQIGGSLSDSLSIPISVSNVTIATLKPMQLLSALKVMQARGKSKLLSSPSVTTLDNHEASTSTTTTVYVSGQVAEENIKEDNNENLGFFGNANTYSVTQKNIGIQLRVTPRINEKSKITLLVDATVEALLSAAEINTDQPRSTNRTVKTQVTVTDGDTVIIGGLIAENILENKKYVPVLSDLPFIGRMFQSTQLTKEQRELLIFITPNVVG
ncbi:MAG: secretin and TonB N-terminal domain-containing protein [Candidatus Neomarinimicrobiota bacterium]